MSSRLLANCWNITAALAKADANPPDLYRRKTSGEIAEGESPALVLGRPLGCRGSRKPRKRGLWTPTTRRTPEQSRYGAFFLEMKDSVNPSIRMVRRAQPIRACITGYKVSELTEIRIL